jgi:inner membrane protein
VIGFAAGFVLAALASTAMITLYLGRVMRSVGRGAQLAAVQAGIYGFLYIVLQLEDYALLAGAVGLVAALAAVMYASRDIDWYGLGRTPKDGIK